MSDLHVDTDADRIGPDAATFASLPQLLARLVFLALPPNARGRASCVCREWRDALADSSLWSRLDMSGVHVAFRLDVHERFNAIFLGAACRARGQLCLLDRCSLRELHLDSIYSRCGRRSKSLTVEAVLAAAPLLQVLTAEYVRCETWEDTPQMLRAEPPFALLQMRCRLVLYFGNDEEYEDINGDMELFGPFAAALKDVALQPALSELCFRHADTAQPALMGALTDAALARRLHKLRFEECTPPAAAPLARLLAEGSLTAFEILHEEQVMPPSLFDAAGAALVAGALRVNTTLTKLELYRTSLCVDMRVAGVILGALVGHPSLREIEVSGEHTAAEDRNAFGVALAALIAANAPALHVLIGFHNSLKDAGLAPILEALALNRHLRKLDVVNNDMSDAFARERLMPAVLANTTLRELRCRDDETEVPAAAHAEELVRLRAKHGCGDRRPRLYVAPPTSTV
jgi:hypothetical protein